MPDWTELRRRAFAYHQQCATLLPESERFLPKAEALLAAAEKTTEVARTPVPPNDILLAGASAVLQREVPCIWYAIAPTIPFALQRFAQAHEFGHYWLHPDLPPTACETSDSLEAFFPPSQLSHTSQIAEGYSPAERREREADIFAAEFLLPTPLLRPLFQTQGWNAKRIADHSGLSLSCVLSQLTKALVETVRPPTPNSGGEGVLSTRPPSPPTLEGDSIPSTDQFPQSWGRGGEKPEVPPKLGARERHPTPALDPSQFAAATIESGPVLVDAGPGTGKTRTLVSRAVHLLREKHLAPENLLALTFSNKAAEEMQNRLREAVGEVAERVWIGTFHAFGFEILRKDGVRLGLPLTPRLVNTVEAIQLLEQHLDRLHLFEFEYLHQPALPFPDILRCISRAKDELKSPADYLALAHDQQEAAQTEKEIVAAAKSAEIAHVYAVYQQLLQENGLLDFGDLLMRPVELLDTFPELAPHWQAQYPHILADEYQDINRASTQLLRRLAGEGQGFWAVGDLRQAIYRFRGASPANVTAFEKDFPGGRRLRLDTNYRSLQALVSLFSAAVQATPWQTVRSHDQTPAITLAVAEDAEAQAEGIAEQVRFWEAQGVPHQDQAILCRTNAQCEEMSELLLAHGIPTQYLGSLFTRSEVRDLLALLSLAYQSSGTALLRVAQFPTYQIPLEDTQLLLQAVKEAGETLPRAMTLAEHLPGLSSQGREGFRKLWTHLSPLLYSQNAWVFLTRYLFEQSDYLHPLLAEGTMTTRQQLLAINQLLSFVRDVTRQLPTLETQTPPVQFLEYFQLLLAYGQEKSVRTSALAEAREGVRLMTVHQSKGLEFPVVYLPNLVDGLFPPRGGSSMAKPPPNLTLELGSTPASEADEDEDSEECLFFVALSRARDHLLLSRPKAKNSRAMKPSPLLVNLEPALQSPSVQNRTWERAKEENADSPPSPPTLGGKRNPSVGDTTSPSELGGGGRTSDRLIISAPLLEQYQKCPRQYYYQRVMRLGGEKKTPYLAFHDSLQQTMQWLQHRKTQGESDTLDEAVAELENQWLQHETLDSAQGRQLRRHAGKMLGHAHRDITTSQTTLRQETKFVADLPHGQVEVRCDQTEQLPDGTLRLVRHIKRRPKEEDHREPRLALLRHAAQQNAAQPVQIALSYLGEGEMREVPATPRFEPARVAKYDEALRGIQEGDFSAHPEDRTCAQCPFFLLCPL